MITINDIGKSCIYLKDLKMLDKNTIGIIDKVYNDWCVIIYPQNSSYEYDEKGGWKPIKNAPNQVYAHSAKFTEIKII
jgi:hypothetical protein